MRIAVLCTDLGVRVPGSKGASLHLEAVIGALARAGHDVLVVGVAGHDQDSGAPELSSSSAWPPSVTVRLYPHPGRAAGLDRELRKLAFVDHVSTDAGPALRAFAPHVVYERLSLFGDAGARLAASCGAHHVVEVNSLLAEEEGRWRELHLADLAAEREQQVLQGADLRVAVSEPTAAAVRRVAPDGPTRVLANGFDAGRFAAERSREAAQAALGLGDGHLLGFAGSLRPWHGLDVAVDALAELPEATLVVAGDGPVRDQLSTQARRRGVEDRVRWLGQLPHPQIPTFLAALDVALLPYPDLPDLAFSPLKLYEYAAAGVPVVASDIGPGAAVVRELASGVLVTPGCAPALAAGVRQVLADLPGWRQAARAARARALTEHSWDSRVAELLRWLTGMREAADDHAA